MGDSWIVDNLNAALNTWNGKLAEIWQLLTESPQTFRGGQVWSVMVGIHGALQAIGYGLLVLFFAIGVVKTCGSFVEVKRPEHALKLFIRFALAKAAVTYGLELMQAVFSIVQGTVSTVITQSGTSGMRQLAGEFDVSINTIQRDITYLARYYPLETAYGRYGGGVYFEQNWQPYRIYMTPLQERALQHAISSAPAEDAVPLQEILQTFARK